MIRRLVPLSAAALALLLIARNADAGAPHVACGGVDQYTRKELLQDQNFANGVNHSRFNTYRCPGKPSTPQSSPNCDAACQSQWATWNGCSNELYDACVNGWRNRLPALGNSKWVFTEIAEKTYFCSNSANPTVTSSQYLYSSGDGSKSLEVDRATGEIRMKFNTSREWRGGFNLNLPDQKRFPVFAPNDPHTNWPHFLIRQDLADAGGAAGKLWLNGYHSLTFRMQARMNDGEKIQAPDCSPVCNRDSWAPSVPSHLIYYFAFVLKHKNTILDGNPANDVQATGVFDGQTIYALVPALYTKNGRTHDPGSTPWLGGDQLGDLIGGAGGNPVYFAPNQPTLAKNSVTSYKTDLITLAREAIAAANNRSARSKASTGLVLNPDDYYVDNLLIGWEVWGSFRNDVTISGLSLEARTYTQHRCSGVHQYLSRQASDHYYTRDFIPNGFSIYAYEKLIGGIATISAPNTQPVYRYFNSAIQDHFYSTNLMPIAADVPGLQGYVYEGKLGESFRTPPGQSGTYIPIYSYWSEPQSDHYYSADLIPGGFLDYIFEPFSGLGYFGAP